MTRESYGKFLRGLFLFSLLVVSSFQIIFYDYIHLPDEQVFTEYELAEYCSVDNSGIVTKTLTYSTENESMGSIEYNLFGIFAIKDTDVYLIEDREVMVGGHSLGILIQTDGASVVGFSPVKDESGVERYPAQEGGIEVGDFIIGINGTTISTDDDVLTYLNSLSFGNSSLVFTVIRGEAEIDIEVEAVYSSESNQYRIGLYIRDSTAGIGTLTYYDEETMTYGGLGHIITSVEDKVASYGSIGSIVRSEIVGITAGTVGNPGEKEGIFTDNIIIGSIMKNTTYGIFGEMTTFPEENFYDEPMEVALASEVEVGPAQIITVLEGDTLEIFDIYIEKVYLDQQSTGKGMIIEITDEELIEITGGIVQGMSGSPIIQNGKLVGAVTHVFVNDPTRGYGTMAEWMMIEELSVD